MVPPVTLRRVLLATERTEFDAGAERVAIALARRLGAELHVVLPIASNPEYLGAEPEVALQAEKQAVAALAELRQRARADGVTASVAVLPGESLWRQIVAAAVADGADLLVTRRVGKRGLLARLLVGEMVSQVAAHAPCPMMMVPSAASGLWQRRVLVSRSQPSAPVLSVAAALATAGGAQLEMRDGAADLLAANAGPADLIVIELDATHVSAGRLAKDMESLIGGAACPAVLMRTAVHGAGT
jgi:nucleotide-binding universal stress UspA family protein